ncbi:MAG: RDD family protein [Planctomycetes bacterium]|nr:RDD family protein [Planctomycetota bacterium]
MLAPVPAQGAALPHEPRAAASLPRRAAAAGLDLLVVGTLAKLASLAATRVGWPEPPDALHWHLRSLATLSVPIWLYLTLGEALPGSATLGKRALGLRVVDTYGGRLPLGRTALRALLKLGPLLLAQVACAYPTPITELGTAPMPRLLVAAYAALGLYVATAMMSLKKQSVHDWATSSYVIRSPVPSR